MGRNGGCLWISLAKIWAFKQKVGFMVIQHEELRISAERSECGVQPNKIGCHCQKSRFNQQKRRFKHQELGFKITLGNSTFK
jgi:hypothetical protein